MYACVQVFSINYTRFQRKNAGSLKIKEKSLHNQKYFQDITQ